MKNKKRKSILRSRGLHTMKHSHLIALGFFLILGAFSIGIFKPVIEIGEKVIGYVSEQNLSAQIGGSGTEVETLLRLKRIALYLKTSLEYYYGPSKSIVTSIVQDGTQTGPVYSVKNNSLFAVNLLPLIGYKNYNDMYTRGAYDRNNKQTYEVYLSTVNGGYSPKKQFLLGTMNWYDQTFSFSINSEMMQYFLTGEEFVFSIVIGGEFFSKSFIIQPDPSFFTTNVPSVKQPIAPDEKFPIKWDPIKGATNVDVFIWQFDPNTGYRISSQLVGKQPKTPNDGVIYGNKLPAGKYQVYVVQYKKDATVLGQGVSPQFSVGNPQSQNVTFGEGSKTKNTYLNTLNVGLVENDLKTVTGIIADIENKTPFKITNPTKETVIQKDTSFDLTWTGSRLQDESYHIYAFEKIPGKEMSLCPKDARGTNSHALFVGSVGLNISGSVRPYERSIKVTIPSYLSKERRAEYVIRFYATPLSKLNNINIDRYFQDNPCTSADLVLQSDVFAVLNPSKVTFAGLESVIDSRKINEVKLYTENRNDKGAYQFFAFEKNPGQTLGLCPYDAGNVVYPVGNTEPRESGGWSDVLFFFKPVSFLPQKKADYVIRVYRYASYGNKIDYKNTPCTSVDFLAESPVFSYELAKIDNINSYKIGLETFFAKKPESWKIGLPYLSDAYYAGKWYRNVYKTYLQEINPAFDVVSETPLSGELKDSNFIFTTPQKRGVFRIKVVLVVGDGDPLSLGQVAVGFSDLFRVSDAEPAQNNVRIFSPEQGYVQSKVLPQTVQWSGRVLGQSQYEFFFLKKESGSDIAMCPPNTQASMSVPVDSTRRATLLDSYFTNNATPGEYVVRMYKSYPREKGYNYYQLHSCVSSDIFAESPMFTITN